ncbi:MAG: twin-arginine translocase TatA/TatE family subunit [Sphingomicrobium sp.]
MGSFSLVHWIVLAVLLLLLFGGNRFSAMMGDVAKGLKSFKQGMADEDKPHAPDPRQIPPQIPPKQNYQQPPIDVTPQPRPADPTAAPPPPPTDDSAR